METFVEMNNILNSLPCEAMRINGNYIENLISGYRTLNVSGREALSPELDTYETGIKDGSTLKSKRYPARKITVQYLLVSDTPEKFREAFNKLAEILDVEDAELIFNDENDKYFIGTPSKVGKVNPGQTRVIGEFELFCADPFKYSVEEYEAQPQEDGSFVIQYNGTYKSYPVLEASFFDESEASEDGVTEKELTGAGDCGYVAFFNEREKIIQLGDIAEVDGEDLPASQLLVHWDFMTAPKWGEAAKKKWTVNDGKVTDSQAIMLNGLPGTVQAFENAPEDGYYLTASNYGSGDKWHGTSITRKLPADKNGEIGATNFTTKFSIKTSIGSGTESQKELGGFQCLLSNGSGSNRRIVAGMNIYKGSTGKTANLRFYVNNKTVHTMDIDLSMYNQYFGNNIVGNKEKGIETIKSVKTCFIEKQGNKVSFNLGGIKKVFTCTAEEFADLQTHEVTCTWTQWHTRKPLSYNGLYYIKFTKHNCAAWREVPNKFNSADVITADCSTGDIYLNDAPTPQYGALGNDWEDFYLKPGINQIGTAYSDFVDVKYAPTFKIRYREVYL